MASINENMMVEKSRFLLGMKAPNYELGELKVLDTYLARINARDPETKLVKFTKGEYEELMGLKQIKPHLLKKNTQALLGKVVTIPYGKKGWEQYTLFTHARCDQDEETLEWTVELGCNEKLEPIFFNIETAGYLRYRLQNIINLTSRYSVLLYLYFKDNMFRTPFEISLKELRENLGADDNKTYESFKYFKRDIIDKCISEINKLTDINVSYERKTRGRITIGLVFNVHGKPAKLLPDEELAQLSFFQEHEIKNVYDNDLMEFYAEAVNYEFTQEQLDVILQLPAVQRQKKIGADLEQNQIIKYDYLKKKYTELNYRCSRADLTPVKDRFAYYKTLIERDGIE